MRGPLITVPELHEVLGEVELFDIRWNLTDPEVGKSAYVDGHIPGAVFVDLDRDLSTEDGLGRHPLPTVTAFAATLGRLGVGARSDVVVYDDVRGGYAARLWWMLRAIGHRGTVRLLDGGWQAWSESGFEVSHDDVAPTPTVYPVPPQPFRSVIDLEAVSNTSSFLLLDARSPERYQGEMEPVDPKAGHIPGAVNVPWQSNLAPDGRLRDPAWLRRRFEELGADRRPTIISCGSGVTSCHLALALDVAGLPRPMLYPGSFSEWSRADMPVVEGPTPR